MLIDLNDLKIKSIKITNIGSGNIGGTLVERFKEVGNEVCFVVKDAAIAFK